jgi:prophage antirepressor-like protein
MSDFIFDEHPIRTRGTPDCPLFVAKDVCMALGIENHRDLLAKTIPEDEQGVDQIYTHGGSQVMLMVTEAGLYRLIFRSDKPLAKRFQDWVFKEVLPQIRRTARFGWLTEAYSQAKTGKVQLRILQELGIGAKRAERNELALRGFSLSQPFDMGRFWAAVEQGVVAKPRPEAFRLSQRKDGWLLYLLPDAVLELARLAADEWWGVSRAELRTQLELQPEWINGKHRQRFGGNPKTGVRACWALTVTKDSPEGLVKLIERLRLKGNLNADKAEDARFPLGSGTLI